MQETIVAIATPLGEGGLGVVRLSGPRAFEIGDKMFRSKEKLASAPTHTLHHGWIQTPDKGILDEVVAAVFRAPHSYTGEDVLEFSCHGSPSVLKDVVRLSINEEARLARPGEFTERAYLNGKMDLLQAEAVASLIGAQSSRARNAAMAQLRGTLSLRIQGIREQIIDLLARIEANLDFSEEDIPIVAEEAVLKSLIKMRNDIDALLSTSVKGRVLREGARVALAGKPNVGKSSLFNALLAEDRAIVTDVPGTTRDTLEEKMEWSGFPIVLIDTAGLRSTGDKVEAEGTERAARVHATADVVFFVVDASASLTQEDKEILLGLKDKRVIVVFNKVDQGQRVHRNEFPRLDGGFIAVSAKEGRGLMDLKEALLHLLEKEGTASSSEVVVTNLRHVRHLEQARERIDAALTATRKKEKEEAIALDLRAALDAVGQITGETVTEDVLSAIFRTFCIGK